MKKLESYENIGAVRDDIEFRKLKMEAENHSRKVAHELAHPPFVTPTIQIPELPEIPSPRENIGRVQKASESLSVPFFNTFFLKETVVLNLSKALIKLYKDKMGTAMFCPYEFKIKKSGK